MLICSVCQVQWSCEQTSANQRRSAFIDLLKERGRNDMSVPILGTCDSWDMPHVLGHAKREDCDRWMAPDPDFLERRSEEMEALRDSTTLHLLPQEALTASIKDMAESWLYLYDLRAASSEESRSGNGEQLHAKDSTEPIGGEPLDCPVCGAPTHSADWKHGPKDVE